MEAVCEDSFLFFCANQTKWDSSFLTSPTYKHIYEKRTNLTNAQPLTSVDNIMNVI